MLNKFWSFLAWAGLYQVPMLILNESNPPPTNVTFTPAEATNTASAFMETLVKNFVSEDGKQVSYVALEAHPFYKNNFQEFRSLLKAIDPTLMEEEARKTFFINLYNILTIDAILSMDSLPRSTISVTKFWERHAYRVGRYTLNLDEIEHGILRGNRPHPTSSKIMFESGDPRLQLAVKPDHRIHSALNCGAMSCPSLTSFTVQDLDTRLNTTMKDFCTNGVSNVDGSTLLVNSIFEWFTTDFGATPQLTLKFMSECVDDQAKSQALRDASEGRRRYNFEYDWTLNAFTCQDDNIQTIDDDVMLHNRTHPLVLCDSSATMRNDASIYSFIVSLCLIYFTIP